ncbi:hypothetical protein H0A70_20975 [Alcaligenaceae bacterium]|nr:hypothetical protein [Alcaligenaceae bacterium]
MSDKRGKDGEHRALLLFSAAALRDDKLEVMRHSKTNSPDMGEDIFLSATNAWVQRFGADTNSDYKEHPVFKDRDPASNRNVRVDVKNRKVVDKPHVQKFKADIKKHGDCDTHIMFGGRLSAAAKAELEEVKQDYPSKEILHVSQDQIPKLAANWGVSQTTLFPKPDEDSK